jgi:hypothetical protein
MKNELTHFMPLLLRRSGHKPELRIARAVYPDGWYEPIKRVSTNKQQTK